MKHLLIGTLAWTLTVPPVPAQKIESETPSREHVVRVQTAMNHLTVIEVGEPVTTVAVGSPQSFKVERRDNKVFVQPLVESVSTNLFIWTSSTRLNYELVPCNQRSGSNGLRNRLPPAATAGAVDPACTDAARRPRVGRTRRNVAEQHASTTGRC